MDKKKLSVSVLAGLLFAMFIFFMSVNSASPAGAAIQINAGSGNNEVQSLTVNALQSAVNYNREKNQKNFDALAKIIAARKVKMIEQIKKSPEDFIKNVLPQETVNQFPVEVRRNMEKKIQLLGTVSVSAVDYPNGTGETLYELKNRADNKNYNLYFGGAAPELKTGSVAQASGIELDGNVAFAMAPGTDDSGIQIVQEAVLPTVEPADHKTLVILLNFANNVVQNVSKAQTYETVFTGSKSNNAYYKEVSYGQISFSGDVIGYFTLPYDNTYIDASGWTTAANNLAVASGVDLSQYRHLVYVINGLSRSAVSWVGMSSVGGSQTRTYVLAEYATYMIYAHELGHALGLLHAGSYSCGAKAIDIPENCISSTYGDLYDIMGGGCGGSTSNHLNAAHKAYLGWIPASRLINVTSSGTYTVYPLETASSGPQALVIDKPDSTPGGKYYIDYRQPYGFDAILPAAITSGVSIISKESSSTTRRYDATPGDNNVANSTLADGKSYVDPLNGVTITQISHSADKATVSITLSDPVCVRNEPVVTITPSSYLALAGVSNKRNYDITAINKDTCGSARFGLSAEVPAGWSKNIYTYNYGYYLKPGESMRGYVTVTNPAAAPLGDYQFKVKMSDIDNPSIRPGFAAGTFSLVDAIDDSVKPVVSITNPANGAAFTKPQTLNVSVAASDNTGVTRVDFYRKGVKVAEDIAAPYGYDWPITEADNGSYSFYAIAYDASGNYANSSTVNVTVNIPDTTPPVVTLSSPAGNSYYFDRNNLIGFSAGVSDKSGVSKVEFYVDNVKLAEDNSSPYNYNWTLVPADNGIRTLTARAYDTMGNVGISPAKTVTVKLTAGDTVKPTVSLVAPADNTIYTSAQTVDIIASAADNVYLSKVEFYNGSVLLGVDKMSPFSYSWAVTEANGGVNSLTAKAYDPTTNMAVSDPITVYVKIGAGDTTSPSVSITAPANNASYTNAQIVDIVANAADNEEVIKVEFYDNGNLLAIDNSFPYSYPWSILPANNGSRSLTAKAYDSWGNYAVSNPVLVNVNIPVGGCIANAECDDGVYCNGAETCQAGICAKGNAVICGDGNKCTVDTCNETAKNCSYASLSDNTSCDGGVCCSGICKSGAVTCSGSGTVCWNGSNQYLQTNRFQMQKFCKCAQGMYAYKGYRSNVGKKTAWYYIKSSNDVNWSVRSSIAKSSVNSVICGDGKDYPTNQTYIYIP